jgi:hypothetical protein
VAVELAQRNLQIDTRLLGTRLGPFELL